MNWNKEFYYKLFSHIYVEEQAAAYPAAQALLSHFPAAQVIPIRHYMDAFSPHRQEFRFQKRSRKLILAVRQEPFVYEGAPVCQDFGNQHFYYTSCGMNCIYDCEYCYLQGMYPSANLVLFVNLPDFFAHVEALLAQFPVYLCISYDTDLLALEGLTGFVSQFIRFTAAHPDLTVECRTKSAAFGTLQRSLSGTAVPERFILAWTLSPDAVSRRYEHGAPSLTARLLAIGQALRAGCRVRLCFDPILRFPGFQALYQELFATVAQFLRGLPFDPVANGQIADVSAGPFRISKEYLSRMRKAAPDSPCVQYPFDTQNGICSYGTVREREMMDFVRAELSRIVPQDRIFLWQQEETELY